MGQNVYIRRRVIAAASLLATLVVIVVLAVLLVNTASNAGHDRVATASTHHLVPGGSRSGSGHGRGTTVAATRRLIGCVPGGKSIVRSGPATAKKEVALTFDDGPWDDPKSIDFVDELKRLHVPATFFEIGSQIPSFDRDGSIERAMLADGDMIGDHTWSHPDMTGLSPAEQRQELAWTIDVIHARTGFTPCLWRPPYGDIDARLVALARKMGLITVMWDVDTRDWARPGTAAIVERATTDLPRGAIIIQHFGGGPRTQTLAAIPLEVAKLRREGYTFVTVTQMLGLKLVYGSR